MGPDDIKLAMRAHLAQAAPGALIVDELGLDQGAVIADVALVHPHGFYGYEIKSAADTVKRLPRQVELYSKVFDRCALVCHPRHTDHALPLLPDWWGVILVEDGRFFVLRDMTDNPNVDLGVLLVLLWREELLAALDELGHARGMRAANKAQLRRRLLELLPADDVRALVRRVLHARKNWLLDDGQRKALRR